MKTLKKLSKGMSLLEILVVVVIFSILGVIVTRSVLLTLRGSKRSESILKVRENINFSLGVIERQLRNADSITTCPNDADPTRIDYVDEFGGTSNFTCQSIGTDGYIASASARLTTEEVNVVSCSFVCDPGGSANPPSVTVDISAEDANAVGIENPIINATTQIFLRSY